MNSTATWKRITLGEIAPANSNAMKGAHETVWNLSLEDIEAHSGKVLTKSYCCVEQLGSAKCCFDERHVLYSKLRPYLNKVVTPDSPGVGTSELIPLLPDRDRLDREFLAFYLRSPAFLNFAISNTRGANLPRIAMAELWKHPIPLPASLSEQRRIVSRIKECMERVEEIEQLRAESALEREALFASALTKAFGELSRETALHNLDDICAIRGGASLPKGSDDDAGDASALLVKVAEMNFPENDRTVTTARSFIAKSSAGKALIKAGAIIFPKRGGAIATNKKRLLGRPALIDPNLMAIEARPKLVSSEFLYYWSLTLDLRSISNGGVIPQLNRKDLAPLKVPVPDLDTQPQLVGIFQALECSCSQLNVESGLRDSDAVHLRDAILRKAFAGEL